MKRFTCSLVVALGVLDLAASPGVEGNKLPAVEQRIPDDLGSRLAGQTPKPIPPAGPTQVPTTAHGHVLNRLTTWQGLLVAAITLALTLIILRPRRQKPSTACTPGTTPSPARPARPAKVMTLVEAFQESMGMDYMRWHDGTGYDLSLLEKATPAERAAIEAILLHEPVTDWRIVEGLSHLRTPATVARLLDALATSNSHEVKMAITEYGADLISVEQRTAAIVAVLREAPLLKGLHLALRQLARFHPPEVMAGLLRATLEREPDVAMHCAAHLLVIHGKAAAPFNEPHRAFLTRFATKIPAERLAAHHELLRLIRG